MAEVKRLSKKKFFDYIEWDPVTKLYVGIIPYVPGARSQGKTLEELNQNLKEVLELCLEEMEDIEESYISHYQQG
ncbi:type II toxin-antitoxin system HicB family antitoxin [Thermodesulfovibrio sp. 3462-1]|uniref:Type II toxin-antitoxin system HicB family antitoxin n=1 Tax=Thermodesulfovibrio obliviosus TaxID=3118332 RepID=A0AAU8H5G1_9BACT